MRRKETMRRLEVVFFFSNEAVIRDTVGEGGENIGVCGSL